jgi:Flp pilus assembly protein TadD
MDGAAYRLVMRKTPSLSRILLLAAASALCAAVQGCAMDEQPAAGVPTAPQPDPAGTTLTIQDPNQVKYYPSDQPLRLGQEYFNRGIFGVAQQYFQAAAEKSPKDPAAWIGLAASYDRIGRFDLADPAYRQAIKLQGETTQILNNMGYSYMLRGNLTAAREKFHEALMRDPDNQTIQNNITLLDGSYQFIERQSQ